jgi:hypothetical protein
LHQNNTGLLEQAASATAVLLLIFGFDFERAM